MQGSVAQVGKGVELAREAEHSIALIQTNSDKVVAVVNDIALAIREQGVAAREIANDVERVAQMNEQSSVASQGAAQLASQVTDLSTDLRRLKPSRSSWHPSPLLQHTASTLDEG
ncbi:MAG: hypothetical protein MZW92_08270 [Comamonadaceae bacterium]|nr:hypothetical protein [Comamonadaceae bacterium]